MSAATKPATYALSSEELHRETNAIQAAWDILQPLDSTARERVLTWLCSWQRSEAPKGREDLF